jgi:hypothetical protein
MILCRELTPEQVDAVAQDCETRIAYDVRFFDPHEFYEKLLAAMRIDKQGAHEE